MDQCCRWGTEVTKETTLKRVASPGNPRIRFDILTIFPALLAGPFDESILRRARQQGIIEVAVHDIRDWATDKHRSVDDTTYGGGAGMVMMAPPIVSAAEDLLREDATSTKVVILSPAGRLFTQASAEEWATLDRLLLISGRYEGIDDRVREILNAEDVSIGDYVLTGGELAAAVIVDAVARLVPGVITAESTADESHGESLVEYPHYTRPPEYRGLKVPEVLLSGHHGQIASWRRTQAIRRTAERRPDLIAKANLTSAERADVEHLARNTVSQSK
jgi:tRNA (guanine37-N1)-methyltransferase